MLLYDHESFAEEVAAVAEFRAGRPMLDGLSYYNEIVSWCVWWLAQMLSVVAVRTRHAAHLRPLFEATFSTRYDHGSRALVSTFAGEPATVFGPAIMLRFSENQRWVDANWQLLIEQTQRLEVIRERYSEIARSPEETMRCFAESDFVITIATRVREQRTVAHWTLYIEQAANFARRLHTDLRLRDAIAEAVGLPAEEFHERAADALQDVMNMNQMDTADRPITILRGN